MANSEMSMSTSTPTSPTQLTGAPRAESTQHDPAAVETREQSREASLRSSTSPALTHRMRHDKSILALTLSSKNLFAGTQAGEILVRQWTTWRGFVGLTGCRCSISTLMSVEQSLTPTAEACSVSACLKTRSGSFLLRQIQL